MSAATKNQTIRIKRSQRNEENPYFLVARRTAQDRDLSFEARGMLVYLLSKPDDWKLHPKDLEQQCGENKVYSILKELKEKRYIQYTIERHKEGKDKGKIIGHFYDVYEEPLDDFPDVAKPDVENHHTYILKNPQNPEVTEKDATAVGSGGQPPVIQPVELDSDDDRPYELPTSFRNISRSLLGA